MTKLVIKFSHIVYEKYYWNKNKMKWLNERQSVENKTEIMQHVWKIQ
jgi:hypothetical protein